MEPIRKIFDFFIKTFRRYFLVGAFTIAPFALTVYILIVIGGWFDSQFQPIIHWVSETLFGVKRSIPGLGILIGLLVLFFVGMAAPSFLGKQLVAISEYVVKKIPLAKVIYSAARQVLDAISQPGADKFKRVVMVPLFKEGIYAIGFVTREAKASWVPHEEDHRVAVFVPTTPNPTSGYLLFLNPKDTSPLALSVEDGLKVVISGALAKPEYLVKAEEKLVEAEKTPQNPVL